jgi:hydroxymethylbilane synthase
MPSSPNQLPPFRITVGSRKSDLAQAQVREVFDAIRQFYPDIEFVPMLIETTGDKDRVTSLRTLGKTDFFTKEIDVFQSSGGCRISIHSAKDLPDPLCQELTIAALTTCVDATDSLVFREGDTLSGMPSGAIIATSSLRREESVKRLRADFRFVDLRGVIEERLDRLQKKEVDGVVIAEAALIRLGLIGLNRLRLPGDTAPMQGQLAVVACKGDTEMIKIFASIDSRKASRP